MDTFRVEKIRVRSIRAEPTRVKGDVRRFRGCLGGRKALMHPVDPCATRPHMKITFRTCVLFVFVGCSTGGARKQAVRISACPRTRSAAHAHRWMAGPPARMAKTGQNVALFINAPETSSRRRRRSEPSRVCRKQRVSASAVTGTPASTLKMSSFLSDASIVKVRAPTRVPNSTTTCVQQFVAGTRIFLRT